MPYKINHTLNYNIYNKQAPINIQIKLYNKIISKLLYIAKKHPQQIKFKYKVKTDTPYIYKLNIYCYGQKKNIIYKKERMLTFSIGILLILNNIIQTVLKKKQFLIMRISKI